MTTTPDPETTTGTAPTSGTGPARRPARPARRPRPMRYRERVQGLRVDDTDTGDDSLGLTPEEWAAGARQMEDEAAQARDATDAETTAQEATQPDSEATDADSTGEETDTGDGTTDTGDFADAFRRPTEEPADRDTRDGRYRAKLRDAEAEADRLRGTVEELQREAIDKLAAGRLADVNDLYRDGTAVADLVGESGAVDPARVDAAVAGVLQAHPHWAAAPAAYRGPLHSGATATRVAEPTRKFVDAFKPRPEGE